MAAKMAKLFAGHFLMMGHSSSPEAKTKKENILQLSQQHFASNKSLCMGYY